MPVHNEIEIKARLTDPTTIQAKLTALGAGHQSTVHEVNIRFDTPSGDLSTRGMVLRLRRNHHGDETELVVTVKTPAELTDEEGGIRVRREVEFTVDDGESFTAALHILGYEQVWQYEKHRQTFTHGEAVIMLDHTPMGDFIEIEGPESAIKTLVDDLALPSGAITPRSYAEIFFCLKGRLALPFDDLLFSAFEGVTIPEGVLQECCA